MFEIDLSHVQINMVPVHVRDDKFDHTEFEKHLRANGIIVKPYNHDSKFYRLVTHRGIR